MRKLKTLIVRIQAPLIAFFVFVFLLFCAHAFFNYKSGQWEKDVRNEIFDQLSAKKSKLEQSLYSRIYYTRGVAGYVALNPDITDAEFRELAREYIKNDTVISTMALAKNGIISSIYPYEGHEAAIGLNLKAHPGRREMVEKTIVSQKTFVAGPVELVEGGVAFVSYTPIFVKSVVEEKTFWGITDIVILRNELFEEAGLVEENADYRYAIRGYDGSGNNGSSFWGDDSIFSNNPVLVNIDLPIGQWVLAVIPQEGWTSYLDQDRAVLNLLLLSALIISVLVWLFVRSWLKVRTSERELNAIFNSLDSLIIEFNSQGEYLSINSMEPGLLVLPKEELIGKRLEEVFAPKEAGFFLDSIQKCIEEKKLVVIEYPIEISGEERWFSARISYKDNNTVLFNSYDITHNKKREWQLIKSEKDLKASNQLKDMFFSIIAHDLRGPLGSHIGILDFFIEHYNELDETQRKDMLHSLHSSSVSIFALLENLLNWSNSQSNKINVVNEEIDIRESCVNVFKQMKESAKQKQIELRNGVSTGVKVIADINLLDTILRNLVTNAIKYTETEGYVKIAATHTKIEDKDYWEITVSDTGVGIESEKMETLFQIDKSKTTPGTANESGSGLGLVLCQEFAGKLGTQITVKSTPGKGSAFSFLLPQATQ